MSATPRHRILVIDDNEAIHSDFRKSLQANSSTERLAAAASMLFDNHSNISAHSPSFDVESAMQGQEGEQKVAQAVRDGKPYAMAFVDMRMPPGWDGVETIQHLWKADPELQVVICTAYTDYSWNQILEKLGLTDRLLILKKPFDPMEVCQLATALSEKWKLKRQATIKQEELERMVHERTAELRQIALMDKLTGLPNRACLNELLKRLMAKVTADAAFKFGLLFMDFDRFKTINDSLGHRAGDELLIQIAKRLHDLVGAAGAEDFTEDKPLAARLGGDEFVIVLPGVGGVGDCVAVAEKVLAGLTPTYNLNGYEAHSTASIGIAISGPEYKWHEDILRDADSAMYRAKSLGRARHAIFSPEMHQNAVIRLTLENDLRRAMKRDEFILHYQPIVSIQDATVAGFEALVRWQHPERGLIPPADFIPLAEEIDLIIPIGKWVIREAARQMQEWSKQIPAAAALTLSVNCSRRQLIDPNFSAIVSEALAQTGLAANRLQLEITESMVMERPNQTLDGLTELRNLGIRLHMDDFGTGYSSLSCLHKLPLNVLKIDQSFIQNVSQRRDYAAVINAIIQLAHNLGMKVVAEGVESAEQVAMLCALDCDFAQGYLFSKPLGPRQAEEFIRAGRVQVLTDPAKQNAA